MSIRRVGLITALGVLGFGWASYWAGMRASIMSRGYRTSKMNFWHVSFLVYGPKPAKQRQKAVK